MRKWNSCWRSMRHAERGVAISSTLLSLALTVVFVSSFKWWFLYSFCDNRFYFAVYYGEFYFIDWKKYPDTWRDDLSIPASATFSSFPSSGTKDEFAGLPSIYPFWGRGDPSCAWQVRTPIIYTAIPFLAMFAFAFVRENRRRKANHKTQCAKCDYPLGAVQEICPECGMRRSGET